MMIDPGWLTRAAMMTGTPLPEGEVPSLAQELGDEREVLPYLLVTRGGFADWPGVRAALAEAGKAVIRPRALAQDTRGGAAQEQREASKDALLKTITVSHESERSAVDDLICLRPRLSRCLQPNDFIATS